MSGRRVVLAYVGDEQLSWGRQAFALGRHYYVMPGILYLAAALRERHDAWDPGDVRCLYFNRAVHDDRAMIGRIAAERPAVLGLSCYSWNLDAQLALAARARRAVPELRVMLGGPAVSYDDPAEAERFLISCDGVDAILIGEGETVIADAALSLLGDRDPRGVPNMVWRDGLATRSTPRAPGPRDLAVIPEIAPTEVEVERTAGAGIAIVYETYRGCPYSCAYCSFHGGSAGIRRFPEERVEREIGKILADGADLIHFADSVFDISLPRAKRFLRFLGERNLRTSLFCYASFQTMDDELAELVEKTRIQCEVGVQSMHDDVLDRVGRGFNIERFERSMRAHSGRRINYYVDLMFGLPGDTMEKFRDTVNRVMALEVPFFMVYPLTVIPRSDIGRNIDRYEVVRYDDSRVREAVKPLAGIVYAGIGLYREFGLEDLARFENLAVAVYFAFQRYPITFRTLARLSRGDGDAGRGPDAFDIFETMGERLRERCEAIGWSWDASARPPIVEGTFREVFVEMGRALGMGDVGVEALLALVKLESTADYLLGRPDRRGLHVATRAREARRLARTPGSPGRETVAVRLACRVEPIAFPLEDLLDLAARGEAIRRQSGHALIVAPYDDWSVGFHEIDAAEKTVLEEIPDAREMPLAALARRMARLRGGVPWEAALDRLIERGIVGVYGPA